MQRIVLNFDGTAAESDAIRRLAQPHTTEVVTVTTDRGQPVDLEPVREQALAAGAARAHVIDARAAFAAEYLLPALQAGVLRDGPELALVLADALVARTLVDVAALEASAVVAHASGAGDGRATGIATAVAALAPAIEVIQAAEQDARRDAGLPGSQPPSSRRGDGNLWVWPAVGPLERDADLPPGSPRLRAGGELEAATLDLAFARGVPAAVNGVDVPLTELLEIVTTIAADHGIGRGERPDPYDPGRLVMYESPAGTVLALAHAALETAVTDDDVRAVKEGCSVAYRGLVRRGAWFSPAREAIDALVGRVQRRVSGTVRLTLHAGSCHIVGAAPDGIDDGATTGRRERDASHTLPSS